MAEVEKKVLLKESIAPSISGERLETKEIPKEETLIAKPVSKSKKSPVGKIAETFLKDDLKNVGSYVLTDVIVPAVRDTIGNIIKEGVDRMLYGGSYSGNDYNRWRNNSRTPYNSLSQGKRQPINSLNRDHSIEDPIFTFRDDAFRVRDEMWEKIGAYGQVSIQQVKSMIGEPSHYVDRDWGWIEEHANRIDVRKVREGYRLYLPTPIYLKD